MQKPHTEPWTTFCWKFWAWLFFTRSAINASFPFRYHTILEIVAKGRIHSNAKSRYGVTYVCFLRELQGSLSGGAESKKICKTNLECGVNTSHYSKKAPNESCATPSNITRNMVHSFLMSQIRYVLQLDLGEVGCTIFEGVESQIRWPRFYFFFRSARWHRGLNKS